jgi:hypothetical protein
MSQTVTVLSVLVVVNFFPSGLKTTDNAGEEAGKVAR